MSPQVERFAQYVATLGRGPGRSRALTREEAADAMRLLLAGAVDPLQIGAFLMLLRYRGEDAEEITGLVLGARPLTCLSGLPVALDWPSYGAGKTRGAPWFLLAALALGQAGFPVLMHGSNDFSDGMSVAQGMTALGLAPALDGRAAAADLSARGFAYVPVFALNARFAELLGLRHLLGLRSPLNTVARLLNPADAPASLVGVFHPPFIETHLAVADRMGRHRLLVLKGGGGEAERNPTKPAAVHLWSNGIGRACLEMPALSTAGAPEPEPDFAGVWRGVARHAAIEARIVGTIALGLLAIGRGNDGNAQILWETRAAAR